VLGAAQIQALLQPEQLEAWQDEQPDERERVLPLLERETPLKLENSLSISCDSHWGHAIPSSDSDPKTSFSNSERHFRH